MMAIELKVGEIVSKFIPIPKRKGLSASAPNDILGHKELFDFYGISCEDLNASPINGTTELETRDGVLYIDWNKRAIVAPLKYYSS